MYIPARDSGHVPAASLDYGGDEKKKRRIDNILLGLLLLPSLARSGESSSKVSWVESFKIGDVGTLLRPFQWPGFWLSPGVLTERWGA